MSELPLIEGSRGDLAYLVQMRHMQGDYGDSRYAIRAFNPGPFDASEGGTSLLTGEFTDGATRSLSIDYARGQFSALARDAHPAANLYAQQAYLSALAGWSEFGAYAYYDNELVSYDFSAGDTDLTEAVGYVDPFPTEWDRYFQATGWFEVDFENPFRSDGICLGCTLDGSIGRAMRVTSANSDELKVEPGISPVLDPKINGQDAWLPIFGVGAAPQLTWNAPTEGVPDGYSMELFKITASNDGADIELERVALAYLLHPGFVIPPRVLADGDWFVARITTRMSTTDGYSWAATITAPFSL